MAKKRIEHGLVSGHFSDDVYNKEQRKKIHWDVNVTMDKKKEIRCYSARDGQFITQWTATNEDAELVWKNPNALGSVARRNFFKHV